MAAEEKSHSRGTLATVVATAAVTLALGVTVAAFGGYLVPQEGAAPPDPSSSPAAAATEASSASRVVLVPISPEPPALPASLDQGRLAAYQPAGGGDPERGEERDDDDDRGDDRDDHDDDRGHDDDEGEHDDD
jgi:hypothetical protein